jgi:hypothetical protein
MEKNDLERIKKIKEFIIKYETKKSLVLNHIGIMLSDHNWRRCTSTMYDNLVIEYEHIIFYLNKSLERQNSLHINNFDLYLNTISNLKCPKVVRSIQCMFSGDFSKNYMKRPNFKYTLQRLVKVRSFEVFDIIDYYFFNNSGDESYKNNLSYLLSSTAANINYIIEIIEDSNLYQNKDIFNYLINIMLSIKDKAIARITYIAICDKTLQKSVCYKKIISSIARTTNYKVARSIYEIALYDYDIFQNIKSISPSNYNQIIELAGFISWDDLFDKNYILKEAKKIR